MSLLFQDQCALITGASGAVGRAIALALAAQGASIRIVGRNQERLAEVARAARADCRVFCDNVDLRADNSVCELAARIERESGRLDILVHSSGVIFRGSVAAAPAQQFDEQYKTNLRAPFVLTQSLLPLLRGSRGQIVFINSTAGLTSRSGVSQYAASKYGLRALADSLRDEVNAEGIRILSIYLGRTASPMQREVHQLEGKLYEPRDLIQPEDVAAVAIAALGLPRTAEVTDITLRPFKPPQRPLGAR